MSRPASKRQKTDTMTTIELSKDGDLFIKAGGSSNIIRVQSALLKAASPFSTLLGPNFLEGNTVYSQAKPLDLPHDGADAVAELCAINHYQPSPNPKLNLLPELIVLADKWQCVAAVRPYVSMVLAPYFDKGLREQSPLPAPFKLEDVVYIAFAIEDATLLWRASRSLVACTDLKTIKVHDELAKIIPGKVFG